MKKWEIEKTKPTFIISTFKTDIIKVGLVFWISNFFIAKTSLANNWRSFSSSYSALIDFQIKSQTFNRNPKQILLCINAAVKTFYYHQSTSKLQILTCIAVVGSSVLKYLICYISSYFFPL